MVSMEEWKVTGEVAWEDMKVWAVVAWKVAWEAMEELELAA